MADKPHRVLLAEDDRFLRRAAEATLRQQGFTVLTAVDGEEALRVVRAETPDVVLLDLIMPKLQGFEVLRAIKEDPATAAIPVLHTNDATGAVPRLLDIGIEPFLITSTLTLVVAPRLVQRICVSCRESVPPGSCHGDALTHAARPRGDDPGAPGSGGPGAGGRAARGDPVVPRPGVPPVRGERLPRAPRRLRAVRGGRPRSAR